MNISLSLLVRYIRRKKKEESEKIKYGKREINPTENILYLTIVYYA
jgi:hypothetical protein